MLSDEAVLWRNVVVEWIYKERRCREMTYQMNHCNVCDIAMNACYKRCNRMTNHTQLMILRDDRMRSSSVDWMAIDSWLLGFVLYFDSTSTAFNDLQIKNI